MRLRTLAVTAGVLAALAAAAFLSSRTLSAPPADPRVGGRLVDPDTVNKAAALRLSDQGKTILLTRAPDGSWTDASYYGMPADFSKLSGFTGDLAAATIGRLVTSSPASLARLGFKDTQIALLDASGRELWSASLGKSPDSGGRFVRFPGEDRAYLANLSSWIDTDPKAWANSQLIDLRPEDVARVRAGFDGGATLTLSRARKDADWSADGAPVHRRVAADKVASLLATLGTLRFSDTSDPADPQAAAARRNARTFALTTFDGRTFTISLGRKPEEKAAKGSAAPNPAGPVFALVTCSDAAAPVNGLMTRRTFQVDEYAFTSLPQKPGELFEPAL